MVFMLLYGVVKKPEAPQQDISYSDFLKLVDEKKVKEVVIDGSVISGKYVADAKDFRTIGAKYEGLIDLMRSKNIDFQFKEPKEQPWYLILLFNALPMLLLIGIWLFF